MDKVALHDSQQGILNGWKYFSEETMVPAELNITHMAHHPPLGSASISTKAIIDAINRAITWEQRFHAFQTALSAFSHKNTDLHSYEIDLGAVHALVLQLDACFSSNYTDNNSLGNSCSIGNSTSTTENNEEILIELILKCLYQILSHCATLHKIRIWQDLGSTELLPLLLRLPSSQLSWSVLRILCKLKIAKSNLLSFSGLMKQIIEVVKDEFSHNNNPKLTVLALGALKDLSFKSGTSDDKKIIWGFISNLSTTFEVICEKQTRERERHKEYIITIWWNLALCPIVARQMILKESILTTLKNIMAFATNRSSLRRSAIAVLGTLVATTCTNKNILDIRSIHHVVEDDSIWKSLIQIVKHELDTDCRRRALRTIRCLVTASEQYPSELLEILVEAAKNDCDEDTRMQALEALRHFRTKNPEWTQALVSIIVTINRNSIEMVTSRSYATACDILQSNCDPVALINCTNDEDFFEALSSAEVEFICMIISIIYDNGGKDKLLSKSALSLMSKVIAKSAASCKVILQILKKLTESSTENCKIMTKYDPLMSAIVSLCLYSTNEDEKGIAKDIILVLVAEI